MIQFKTADLPEGVICEFDITLKSSSFDYLFDRVNELTDFSFGPFKGYGILRMRGLPGVDNVVHFWLEKP